MAIQTYYCQVCDRTFEATIPIHSEVPKGLKCPNGEHFGVWRPPTGVQFTMK